MHSYEKLTAYGCMNVISKMNEKGLNAMQNRGTKVTIRISEGLKLKYFYSEYLCHPSL
jgi:hypothetical protein